MEIDIVIDSLTNCLVCNKTGKELDTEFKEIIVDSVLATKLNQEGWKFDWSKPAKEGYTLLALYIKDDKKIQGIVAIKHIVKESFTHLGLIESSPDNIGKDGKYKGVGGHLFAIACKLSWDTGNDGFVQFTAKTALVEHYVKSFGAKHITDRLLYIDTYNASKLINKYIKEVQK